MNRAARRGLKAVPPGPEVLGRINRAELRGILAMAEQITALQAEQSQANAEVLGRLGLDPTKLYDIRPNGDVVAKQEVADDAG